MGDPPSRPDFQSAYDDDRESKVLAKSKQNPFVPIGVLGAVGALAYSAFKFKNRGEQKLSVYLIHTRMAAQGAVVTALFAGVAYQLYLRSSGDM